MLLVSLCVCRWWAGEWEACSATCGPHGEKKRTVLCVQTTGSDEQALPAKDCQHLLKPKTLISCNRDILCPSDWTVGNWSEVRVITPRLFINQSRAALEKLVQWPVSATSGLFTAFPWGLVSDLVYFIFLRDLLLSRPGVGYLPGVSWIPFAQARNS